MRIGRHTNGIVCEIEMQRIFNKWLGSELLERQYLEFIDELRVKEINRIADFLIWKPGNGLINVEAKSNPSGILLEQLKDHATYCHYSFAFIPDYTLTPIWFKKKLIEYGFGLIVFNYDNKAITEAIEAHRNKKTNSKLRNMVLCRMREEIIKRKSIQEAQKHVQQKLSL